MLQPSLHETWRENISPMTQRKRCSQVTICFSLVGSMYGPTKIAKPTVLQAVLRGIGKSFQSAITAPRIRLTGYGNATAQS